MSSQNDAADAAARLKAFKNKGKDNEELRRRRNEVSVELRKSKKEEMLSKRRNVCMEDMEPTSPLQEKTNRDLPPLEDVAAGILQEEDLNLRFKSTLYARRILSRERNPPIDKLLQMGIVPRLVQFLSADEHPDLQFEAAWALTNVASGTHTQTQYVVECGAVPKFIALLSSRDGNVCEQAVWALGNIAGDGSEFRDLVLDQGILKHLIPLILCRPDAGVAFLRNVTWTLSNLCRNKNPSPSIPVMKKMLPVIKFLLGHVDSEIQADSCWALSYLSDGCNDRLEEIVHSGVIAPLVAHLTTAEINVITPALRALGNLVTGTDSQTDAVIECGVLPALCNLLKHNRMNLVKEAAWTVSNITAGNVSQIQQVIDAGLLPALIDVLVRGDFRAQKEACWAVTNLTSGGSVEQVIAICQLGVLQPFCDLLDAKDEKSVAVILDGLTNILNTANRMGEVEKVTAAIEECGGLDKIEALQMHDNQTVYEKALLIIDTYYAEEEMGAGAVDETTGELKFDANQQQLPNSINF